MKQATIALMIMLGSNIVYSQEKQSVTAIEATDLKHPESIKGKNLKVNDSSLDKYEGTWTWSDDGKSLKIKFVKQVHHYGSKDKVLDMEVITGSYNFSENGKTTVYASNEDFIGSSGGKNDSLNVFMVINSRKTRVALLVTYINKNKIKLELEKNRFEFKNDKSFEIQDPIFLIRG
ncbi:MAG: hypothetical protein JSU01_17015 [Bacteroidetes bacterium]|nr:hypothetical protein [Bacteroidota bacterium]